MTKGKVEQRIQIDAGVLTPIKARELARSLVELADTLDSTATANGEYMTRSQARERARAVLFAYRDSNWLGEPLEERIAIEFMRIERESREAKSVDTKDVKAVFSCQDGSCGSCDYCLGRKAKQ